MKQIAGFCNIKTNGLFFLKECSRGLKTNICLNSRKSKHKQMWGELLLLWDLAACVQCRQHRNSEVGEMKLGRADMLCKRTRKAKQAIRLPCWNPWQWWRPWFIFYLFILIFSSNRAIHSPLTEMPNMSDRNADNFLNCIWNKSSSCYYCLNLYFW